MSHIYVNSTILPGEHKNNLPERRTFFRYPPVWSHYLLLLSLTLAFDLYRLGATSIWFDEALSIERARQPLSVLWSIIWTTQPNMALYYLLLHYWLSITNALGLLPTEFIVRLPSTLCATLSTALLYHLARRFLGSFVACLSIMLYILNPLQLTYAQETRSYSLQLFLLCLLWYVLLTALTTIRYQRFWWLTYSLVLTLSVYTHIFSLFVIAAQVSFYLLLLILPGFWRKQTRAQCLLFSGSLGLSLLILLPFLRVCLQGPKTGWIAVPQVSDAIHVLTALGSGKKQYLFVLGLAILLASLIIPYTAIFGKRLRLSRSLLALMPDIPMRLSYLFPLTLALLCWSLIPFGLSYLLSQGSMRFFSGRYLVVIMPPLLLLAALGVSLLPRPALRVLSGVLLVYLAFLAVPYYYQSAQVEDWQQATAWLQQYQRNSDGAICYDNAQGCQLCIEYYLRAYPTGTSFPADSPGAFPWVHYDLTNQLGNTEAAIDLNTIATYGTHHPRLFFITARLSGADHMAHARLARQWLDSHYHLQTQITTNSVVIRLYQTTTRP